VWVVELMLVWLVITIDANQTDDINVEFVFCYNLVSLARVNWRIRCHSNKTKKATNSEK